MKNKNKLLYTILFTLSFLFLLSGCTPASNESTTPNSESESLMTEDFDTQEETESQIETEEETQKETESTLDSVYTPQSYNESIELEFVEKPVKRTYEQALEDLKEMSRWYPAMRFVYENADKYPQGLLISAVGNPEMTSYLYGYLTADGSVTGGFTDEEQPEDYPLFLQFDPRWGYMSYGPTGNMASSGCGPTCLSMAVFYLTGNRDCTPDKVAIYSEKNGHYVNGVGTAWSLLTEYPKTLGLSSYQVRLSEANLKSELDKGKVLICSVRFGNFTSAGHFIVIYGYDENGFKVNDPKCVYRSQLSWTYEQIKGDIKATWAIGR